MSNGESGARITHVHRVFKDNDPESATWIDVERIDELHLIVSGTQRVHYVFNWDLMEADDYAGPVKTIANPHDENNTIDIPVREIVHVKGPKGRVAHHFLNDETNQSRQTHSRRIYYHAIKDSYLIDKKPPRDPIEYLNALGSQDKNQFIDVEILDAYITGGYDRNDIHGFPLMLADGVTRSASGRRQRKIWDAKTDDPFMHEPLLPTDEEGGTPGFMFLRNPAAGPQIDPPWRLDPLQNIVNVSWARAAVFVAVTADGEMICGDVKAKDNQTWRSAGKMFGRYGNGSCIAVGVYDDNVVFVAAGYKNDNDVAGACIVASRDGLEWKEVKFVQDGAKLPVGSASSSFSAASGIVWNEAEKRFYVSCYERHNAMGFPPDLPPDYSGPPIPMFIEDGEHIYTSNDGFMWSDGGSLFRPDPGIGETYVSMLEAHYDKPVNEGDGGRIPDGIAGYDKSKGIKGVPQGAQGYIVQSHVGIKYSPDNLSGPFPNVVFSHKDPPDPDNPPPLPDGVVSDKCWAVAFTPGVWAAATDNSIQISFGGKDDKFESKYDAFCHGIVGADLSKVQRT